MKKLDVAGNRTIQSGIAEIQKRVSQNRYAEVVDLAQRYLRMLPADGYLRKALVFGLIGLGRHEDALPIVEQAVRTHKNDHELQNNLGICYSQVCRWTEAIAAFDQALRLAPKDPEIWKNKGAAFHYMYHWPQAIECLVKAVELYEGDYVEAVELLASALLNGGVTPNALTCYEELFKVQPENLSIASAYLRTCLVECQWDRVELLLAHLRQQSDGWRQYAAPSLYAASFPGVDAGDQYAIVRAFAPKHLPGGFLTQPPLRQPHCVTDRLGTRIRVGYLSSDLRDHPVGHVIATAITLHDKSSFEVFGYSMGTGDDSEVRRRLMAGFEHWVDVGEQGVQAIAQRIYSDDIDILIDLQGWTTGCRPEVLALRPARFQGGWIGYPGTMGVSRLADFLIADAVTIPPECEKYYVENVLRMPHCLLPLDTATLPVEPMDRASLGLPAHGFVFCSLNNSYKFNPQVFDVWCLLLREAPGSILWLGQPKGNSVDNLKREATARGVDGERLYFASRVASRAQYLGNIGVADLALDTWPYNSHSTGMDVLWSGVPMVSLLGETFAGRVGASLLTAAGLTQCIARSCDEYVDIALGLYRDDERRRSIRQSLIDGRPTLPLFDMPNFVRGLERLYAGLMATGDNECRHSGMVGSAE